MEPIVNYSTKKAFTLIELIISIVIIALASATLPMMLSSSNKLEEQTINQDIFFKSVTVMTDILSRSWDKVPENDNNSGDANTIKIWYLSNTNKDESLTGQVGYKNLFRYGSLQNYNYRKFYSENNAYTNASDIPSNSAKLDGSTKYEYINEYNNKYISESIADGANVDYNISVRYVSDRVDTDPANPNRQKATWTLGESGGETAADKSTNLKRITILATRKIGGEEMKVSFSYFSSNIGSPGLKTDPAQ